MNKLVRDIIFTFALLSPFSVASAGFQQNAEVTVPPLRNGVRLLSAAPLAGVYVRDESGNLFIYRYPPPGKNGEVQKEYLIDCVDAVVAPGGDRLVVHQQKSNQIARLTVNGQNQLTGSTDGTGLELIAVSDSVQGHTYLLAHCTEPDEVRLYDIEMASAQRLYTWKKGDGNIPRCAAFAPRLPRFVAQHKNGFAEWNAACLSDHQPDKFVPTQIKFLPGAGPHELMALDSDGAAAWFSAHKESIGTAFQPMAREDMAAWTHRDDPMVLAGASPATNTAPAGSSLPAQPAGPAASALPAVPLEAREWPVVATSDKSPGHVLDLAVSSDENWILTTSADSGNRAVLWRMEDGSPKLIVKLDDISTKCYAATFSPDNNYLAIADIDGTIRIYKLKHDKPALMGIPFNSRVRVNGLAWDPKNVRVLAAGCNDGTLKVLWFTQDQVSDKCPIEERSDTLTRPDGMPFLPADFNKSIAQFFGVAFSADGAWLLACGPKEKSHLHGGALLFWHVDASPRPDTPPKLVFQEARETPQSVETAIFLNRETGLTRRVLFGTYRIAAPSPKSAASTTPAAATTVSQVMDYDFIARNEPSLYAELPQPAIFSLLSTDDGVLAGAGDKIYLLSDTHKSANKMAGFLPVKTQGNVFALAVVSDFLLVGCNSTGSGLFCFKIPR